MTKSISFYNNGFSFASISLLKEMLLFFSRAQLALLCVPWLHVLFLPASEARGMTSSATTHQRICAGSTHTLCSGPVALSLEMV